MNQHQRLRVGTPERAVGLQCKVFPQSLFGQVGQTVFNFLCFARHGQRHLGSTASSSLRHFCGTGEAFGQSEPDRTVYQNLPQLLQLKVHWPRPCQDLWEIEHK